MGKTMEAASGMAAHMGYGDGTPVLTGPAYLDPIGGLNAVTATLMALNHRDVWGRGCRVEVPQVEASLHWIGELVLHQADGTDSLVPNGNSVSYAAPHDAYSSIGDDEWIAIAVEDDQRWGALCNLMGRPDLAHSNEFSNHSGRVRHRDELDTILSQWTSGFTKHDLAARLQEVGVAAAPVCNGADVARSEALRATHFIRRLNHPEAGSHDYPTLAYHLARTPGGVPRSAPCFGEQNDTVLRDILGLSEESVQVLKNSGAIADGPIVAAPESSSAKSSRLIPSLSPDPNVTPIQTETE
jgi:crotonobetainyl-CoA:carnitine CoA-transferase CaiB-like acyl-CoA transferase